MTDSNTTQPNDAEAPDATTPMTPATLSELLPLVARRLKTHGVARVTARYEGEEFAFMFMSTEERPMAQLSAVMTAHEIRRAFRSILDRRYPDAAKTNGTYGFFEWDLAADTLQHEHVITHHGI